MDKNLQSPSHLTEFAPLSPEPSQPGVGFLLSKFFRFNKGKTYSTEDFKIIMECFFNK
jgi:1-phosphatidylinositol-3-phosphate 5-kinase